jgi:hypothetical protein
MPTDAVSPLRQRMIEDMNARKLCAGTQRGHIRSCKRFAAFSSVPLRRPHMRTSDYSSCTWPRQGEASVIATAS